MHDLPIRFCAVIYMVGVAVFQDWWLCVGAVSRFHVMDGIAENGRCDFEERGQFPILLVHTAWRVCVLVNREAGHNSA